MGESRKIRNDRLAAYGLWVGGTTHSAGTTTVNADIKAMVPYAINWQIKETLGSSTKSPATDRHSITQLC